jgi:CheY-like chemotaxis protein
MAKPRILIVEDECVVALAIRAQLTGMGFEVVETCCNGGDAVLRAAELTPDLVLMDIRLEGEMNGVDAAIKMRAAQDVPVIFLTAYSDEATLENAKLAEPMGYLVKPFDDRALRTTIEVSLHKHRLDRSRKQLVSEVIEGLTRLRG